jgi:imidazolonepropionase-like amidohydrolase
VIRRPNQASTQGAGASAVGAAVLCAVVSAVVTLPPYPALAQSASSVVAYENARLIPGDGRPPIERAVLLVEGGRIRQVGAAGSVRVPSGAARVDLAGKTIIPALVNAHTHPGFQRGASYARENYTREQVIQDLERAHYFGVAAVLSQGIDPGDVASQIRVDQAAGRVGGARLLHAGRGIGSPNAGPGAAAYQGIAYELTTPDAGRAAVAELAAQKVDMVKIWVDDRNGRAPRLSESAFRAIIDEAHRRGLRTNAHVFYLEDLKQLVDAGVDGLAHLARDAELDDAVVAAIVKRGVAVMPTLATPERTTHTSVPPSLSAWLDGPDATALGAPVVERVKTAFGGRTAEAASAARQRYVILQRSVAKLAKAGAKLLLGSDTGIQDHPFGFTDHRELEMLVEAGATPMQALVAATSRSAEYLRLGDLGTLAAGKTASFVVLDANPLDDITNTRRIADVYIGGRRVDRPAFRSRQSTAR